MVKKYFIPFFKIYFETFPQGLHILATLLRQGLINSWVHWSQDSLPQKAGCPQERVIEISGSWYDPANPVVKKNGVTRGDNQV